MTTRSYILFCMVLLFVCCKKNVLPVTVTDIDGNVYNTVKIGDQVWMAENLKTTTYNDGAAIQTNLTSYDWENTVEGAFGKNNPSVYYDFNYYNWFAVQSGKLCPKGWRIPNNINWQVLTAYLGEETIAGGKMKSTSSLWDAPNAGATNSSGFNALPSGFHYGGSTSNFHNQTTFWSQTIAVPDRMAYSPSLNSDFPAFHTTNYAIFRLGFPCRCLKE